MFERFSYMLSRGDVGLIFPEGGRSRSGRVDVEAPDLRRRARGEGAARLPRAVRLPARRRADDLQDAPARGERFRVLFASLEPKTEHGGHARLARDHASRSWRASRRSKRTGSMLGNDVVDLGDPETRPGARHPRFDARVFTREERAALAGAARSGAAALEPVGGEGSRLQVPEEARAGDAASRRVRFAVRLETRARPERATAAGGACAWRSWQEGDALHAVATDGARPRARRAARGVGAAGRGRARAAPPQAVRALARDAAAAHLGCAPGELELRARGPRAAPAPARRCRVDLDLSLSHHGRFLAAALETDAGSRARHERLPADPPARDREPRRGRDALHPRREGAAHARALRAARDRALHRRGSRHALRAPRRRRGTARRPARGGRRLPRPRRAARRAAARGRGRRLARLGLRRRGSALRRARHRGRHPLPRPLGRGHAPARRQDLRQGDRGRLGRAGLALERRRGRERGPGGRARGAHRLPGGREGHARAAAAAASASSRARRISPPAFASAGSEARAAFGDGRLFIERKVSGGRHIEVQIAADQDGVVLALGCRDCSVQRRHQKVLEEAPPPGIPARLLAELSDAAVRDRAEGRLLGRRHRRVPGLGRGPLLPRDEPAAPGRARGHRVPDGHRPRPAPDPDRARRDARAARAARGGLRDRGARVRRGPGRGLPAGSRPDRALRSGARAARAHRHRRHRRQRRAARPSIR